MHVAREAIERAPNTTHKSLNDALMAFDSCIFLDSYVF